LWLEVGQLSWEVGEFGEKGNSIGWEVSGKRGKRNDNRVKGK